MSSTGSPGRTPGSPVIRARQLVGATSASAATTLWLALLGLLTTPYMLHELGAAAYGVFALITIVSAYLSNLEFGFGHALVRFAARAHATGDEVQERRVLETSLAVFFAAALVAGGAAFLLAPRVVRSFATVPAGIQDEAVNAARYGAGILFFALMATFFQSTLAGLGRFQAVVAMRAIGGTLISASAVATVAFGGELDDVLLVQLLVGSVSFLVLAALVSGRGRWLLPRFHRPTASEMARYAGFVFLAGLAYQLMLQGPPTVLAGHVDTAELATYTVPAIVLQQVTLLATSASLGFLPLASAESASADRSRLAAIFRSHVRLSLLVMGPIAAYLAIFAEPLLATWIDADFAAEAADPLRFLSAAAIVLAISGPPADVARGLGRPAWIVAYTVSAAALEIVLALALVSRHGAAGVAAGMWIGLTLATLPLLLIVARRLLDLPSAALAAAVAPVLLAVLALTGLYAAGAALGGAFAGAIVTGTIATAAYAAVVWTKVLDDGERRALSRR
ncbi:MAG TPA: MATE family efflux transporter [Solirubrobacteraceae bacterium]|nr:MATE family efflux transporter [Solirubrobacteraceae bacterium]